MTVLVVIEAVVIALLALLVAGLLRSHAEILRALHDLGVGLDPSGAPATGGTARSGAPPSLAPADAGAATLGADVSGVTPGGDPIVVGVVGTEHPTLLAFLSSGCMTCHGFWDTFARPALAVPGGARVVVVTMGDEAESVTAVANLARGPVPVVMSSEAWDAYDVPGSPYFVFVDGPTGAVVGQGTAPEWDQVVTLMTQASDDGALAASRSAQRGRTTRAARRHLDAAGREERADEALLAAGIGPGHPSLYASPEAAPEPSPRPPDPHA
jgi:hypothetical protein